MATYQKRGERWRAIIRKSGHRPVSKSFRTKSAARRWARETEDGIESRQFSDPRDIENVTIDDLIDRYIEEFDPKPTKKGRLNIVKVGWASITCWSCNRLTSSLTVESAAGRGQSPPLHSLWMWGIWGKCYV